MAYGIKFVAQRVVFGLSLAFLSSCSRGGGDDGAPPAPSNHSPVIGSLAALPASVLPGQTSILTVTASDPEGDPISYSWSATGGTLTGTGASVTWEAPGAPGTCTVTVTASDGLLSDQAGIDIAVTSPNAWLTGAYFIAGFEHDAASSHHVAVTGTLNFDGAGGYTSTMTVNVDGIIESQAPASTYSVTGTGDVSVNDGSGGILEGGLDSTHQVAVVARVTSGMNPLIVVAVRRSGAYTQSTLSGDYHVAAYHWDWGQPPAYAALTGVGTFDPGAGTFSFTATNNWGGTVYAVSASLNYSVASDGSVTLSDPFEPSGAFSGGILTGGDIMVGATTGAGGKPMMLVAIRKSGAFTVDTMTGAHRLVSIGPSGSGASTWTGLRVFDGVDSWAESGTLNDSGAAGPASASGAYSITAEGRLSISTFSSNSLWGVRETGSAAAGASITSGEAPRFGFSVRK